MVDRFPLCSQIPSPQSPCSRKENWRKPSRDRWQLANPLPTQSVSWRWFKSPYRQSRSGLENQRGWWLDVNSKMMPHGPCGALTSDGLINSAVTPPEDTQHVEAMSLPSNTNPSMLPVVVFLPLYLYPLDPGFFPLFFVVTGFLRNLFTGLFIFNYTSNIQICSCYKIFKQYISI